MAVGEKSYITGRARRWFWPGALMLVIMMLWSAISSMLYPALLERVNIDDRAAFLMAGVLTFLHTAAWAVIMGVYGLRNKVKAFKMMFLILGGLYVLNAYGHYVSNYYVSYILTFRGGINTAMIHIANVISLALKAAWIAFAVVMICHRRTGGVLRISAIVLVIAQLAGLVYSFNVSTIFEWLNLRYDAYVASNLAWFLEFVMLLITFVPVIFLLGAMSFSRMKGVSKTAETDETTFPQV